jgi:chromate transporter
MQKDLVEERKWQTLEEFNQALALIKAMPGPLAFSVASYLGTTKKGFWGGIIAGWSLVLPPFLMMLGIAYYYESLHGNEYIGKFLLGMQAGSLAVIFSSIRSLSTAYHKEIKFWAILVSGVVLFLLGIPEPVLILFGGLLSYLLLSRKTNTNNSSPLSILFPSVILKLMWICFSSGAFVFGTGIAIIPILEHAFVVQEAWITHPLFMDALTFGQLTPGPVLITVTFLGYKVAGLLGAILATLMVFLPSSFHMTTWFPPLTRQLSKKTWISKFTLGAIAVVVGTLLIVTGKLILAFEIKQQIICILVVIFLFFRKAPAWLMILGSGLFGFFIF